VVASSSVIVEDMTEHKHAAGHPDEDEIPDGTKLSRAAAIMCFQIPSRRRCEASCHPTVPLRDRWGKLDAHPPIPASSGESQLTTICPAYQ
jgi:hypothetical protein